MSAESFFWSVLGGAGRDGREICGSLWSGLNNMLDGSVKPLDYCGISPAAAPDDSGITTGAGSSRAGIAGLASPEHLRLWAADASRQQRTPGSYEWWYFDAVDAAGNGAIICLFDGFCFHPRYLAEIRRYHRRMRAHDLSAIRAEVLASHYPAAYVSAYQGGRCVARFVNMYPPDSFRGSPDSPELQVGPNRVTLRHDNSLGIVARGYPTHRTAGGVRHRRDHCILVDLNFNPTYKGVAHIGPFRPDGADGARHTWVVSTPHAKVTGRVQHVDQRNGVTIFDIPINAIGYHDHNFGGSGIARGIKRFTRGRALGNDSAIVWNHALTAENVPATTNSLIFFQANAEPIVIMNPKTEVRQSRISPSLVRYPTMLTMHGSDTHGNSAELLVALRNLLETTPYSVRTTCSVELRILGRKQVRGEGIMETSSVHSLNWPILSDAAFRTIRPIDRDDPLWRQ